MSDGVAVRCARATREQWWLYLIHSSQSLDRRSTAEISLKAILFTLDWPYYAHRVSLYSALGGP
jgi:hypothetical protein